MSIVFLSLVLHCLGCLGREGVRWIERIFQERVIRQRPLKPDKEEVREIRIRNSIVVGRIGEPDASGLVRKRVVGSISNLKRG